MAIALHQLHAQQGRTMDQRYTGVVARALRDDERRVPTDERQTPLVIEPLRSRDSTCLQEVLASHSPQIMEDIARHGAVLLRGFDLTSPADFEREVLSIRGMRGLNEVLMSEAGRTVVKGTRFVLFTNANYKTGGTLEHPMFHTENYYVADVPHYISFFCIKPSWLGGETGLLNTARLYADLPDTLRAKLEQQPFAVREYSVADVAARYGLSPEEVQEFCTRSGVPTTTRDGRQSMMVYKPSVVEHPTTHERAFVINFGGELNSVGLGPSVAAAFAEDYAGSRWLVHRFHWRFPSVIPSATLFGGLFVRPLAAWPYLGFKISRLFTRRGNKKGGSSTAGARVGGLFERDEIEILARAMRRRYSSFLWKRGDLLILDNLTMAHAGMPGFGPRNLKALICNCVPLPYSGGTSGLCAPGIDESRECLGAQLVKYRQDMSATAPS